jgi:uncharacterized protein (DUF3084 family)
MTSAYILIASILLLGGILATLGDRIGTKVGKARLSLFNLRPRKTATLVTVITGSLISTSTLGILFATSGSLRDGIFELDNIKRRLRVTRDQVNLLDAQKAQTEQELAKARTQQATAQKRLDAINQNFQKAQAQLKDISKQAMELRSEIQALLSERQALMQQRNQLSAQISQLQSQIQQLRASIDERDQELSKRGQTIEQRNRELAQKNQTIQQLDQELAQKADAITESEERLKELQRQFQQELAQRESRFQEREQQLKLAIAQRETRLQELEKQLQGREKQLAERDEQLQEREKQLAFLQRQAEALEQYYQNYQVLRQGNVAIIRGQVLAFGVVRIVDAKAAPQAVEELLREANRKVLEITRQNSTNANEPVVQIPTSQVEQLIKQIQDGKDYVIRILSAGNYVEGEKDVQVFADAVPNQVVFEEGDLLATISTDASTMTDEEIRKRLDQLVAAAQFRARRAGILGNIQIGDGRIVTIINFIEEIEKYNQPVDIKAIAQEKASAAGPLKMQLVAMHNGQVIFRT